MDNKCPKCSEKLKVWYLKQNCPHCGCDLLFYNMEEKLQADAEKAEAEFEAVNRFLAKITPSFIKKRKENTDENYGIE